jgi:succinylglutamic semialdehyde dehydrogenase
MVRASDTLTSLLIAGSAVRGAGPEFTSTNPATGSEVAVVAAASSVQVVLAVASARTAAPAWAATDIAERRERLERFAVLMRGDDGEQLARLIAEEAGKPLWEARTEVAAVAGKVAASIEAAEVRGSDIERSLGSGRLLTRFVPLGVLAVIGPFNFPAHMPNGHIVPGLLAGNTVVFKPSPLTPVSSGFYASVLATVLPEGVLNVVHGGVDVAEVLLDQAVDGVCFTGSREAGVSIHRNLAGRPEVQLALEMGGVNPLIVSSYQELDVAVHITLNSAFVSAGQRCNCARRLLLVRSVADEFLARLVELSAAIDVGDPLDEANAPFMGPVITSGARDRVLQVQDRLLATGGRPLLEARPLSDAGYFVTPGIVDVSERTFEENEIFGPFLQVEIVAELDDALDRLAKARYGLAAGLVSKERNDFDRFAESVQAGLLSWNQQLTGASALAPFGGLRLSGNHHPAGFLSVDYVTDAVAVTEVPEPALPATRIPGLPL